MKSVWRAKWNDRHDQTPSRNQQKPHAHVDDPSSRTAFHLGTMSMSACVVDRQLRAPNCCLSSLSDTHERNCCLTNHSRCFARIGVKYIGRSLCLLLDVACHVHGMTCHAHVSTTPSSQYQLMRRNRYSC